MPGFSVLRTRDREMEDGAHRLETIFGACGYAHHALRLLPVSPNRSGSFRCSGCGMINGGPLYHCSECDYDLCLRCEDVPRLIKCPRSLDHELEFVHTSAAYFCNLCHRQGNKDVYICVECDYYMHRACASLERRARFSGHPLIFLKEYYYKDWPAPAWCNVCLGTLLASRWVYRCATGCNFHVHALCSKHPELIVHPAHGLHCLSLREMPQAAAPAACAGCNDAIRGKHYLCGPCLYRLHPWCAILPFLVVHEGKLPKHRCVSSVHTRGYVCATCGRWGSGWEYYCRSCNESMHTFCVMDRNARLR